MSRSDIPSDKAPNFNARIRETLMTYLGKIGDPLDRGVTFRDLIESGIVSLANIKFARSSDAVPLTPGDAISQTYTPDLTPPPTPTGFAVTPGITTLVLEHDNPFYTQGHGHLRTRVYGAIRASSSAPAPTFSNAVEITQFSGTITSYSTNPATTWHLWAKWESVDGVLSVAPAGGTNGVVATTGQDVQLLLDALTGQITESQLYNALNTRLDKIENLETTYGTTASAAESAAAAVQAKTDAILAKGQAEAASTSASTYATNANTAKTAAETAKSNAETAATNAASSATTAAGSASNAATSASTAATSATNAGTSATSAATSATNASTYATNAGTAATAADASKVSAATSAANAATSATNAATSETNAAGSASSASSSATTAATSATNAGNSATAAASSATTASTKATEAGTSATTASTAKTNAETAASNADTYAANAATAASNAQGYSTSAATSLSQLRASVSAVGLIYNAAFEGGDGTGWAGLSSITSSPYGAMPKAYAGVQTTRDAFFPDASVDKWFACNPGEQFEVSAWVSAQYSSPRYAIGIQYERTNGNTDTWTILATHTAPTAAAFLKGYWTAPSDARRVRFWGQIDTVGTENPWHITDVQLRRSDSRTAANAAAIQTLATTTAGPDGATAQYTIKLDTNNYISGFGLSSASNAAGANTSAFAIRADEFYIANPAGPSVAPAMPFIVRTSAATINGVEVPAGVYMTDAFIQNGTITNAKIANLAVDDAKIDSLSAAKITTGFLSADRIQAGSLDAKIANIDTAVITSGTFDSARIADAAITTAKIGDGQITSAKIGDAQITNAKIGDIIQSTNYAANSTGWKIDKNGTAEFNGPVISRNILLASGSDTLYNGQYPVIRTSNTSQAWGGTQGRTWYLQNWDLSAGKAFPIWVDTGYNSTVWGADSRAFAVTAGANGSVSYWSATGNYSYSDPLWIMFEITSIFFQWKWGSTPTIVFGYNVWVAPVSSDITHWALSWAGNPSSPTGMGWRLYKVT